MCRGFSELFKAKPVEMSQEDSFEPDDLDYLDSDDAYENESYEDDDIRLKKL